MGTVPDCNSWKRQLRHERWAQLESAFPSGTPPGTSRYYSNTEHRESRRRVFAMRDAPSSGGPMAAVEAAEQSSNFNVPRPQSNPAGHSDPAASQPSRGSTASSGQYHYARRQSGSALRSTAEQMGLVHANPADNNDPLSFQQQTAVAGLEAGALQPSMTGSGPPSVRSNRSSRGSWQLQK